MSRRLAVLALVIAACGDAPAPTVTGALGDIPGQVDGLVSALYATLDHATNDQALLVRRLTNLELSAQVATLYDRVTRIGGEGIEAGLARYQAFVGELLLASGDLDAALALAGGGSGALAAIAWLRIEAGAGAMAIAIGPQPCPNVAPSLVTDLCLPPGVEGYDAGVEVAVRRFLASYRPVMRLPAVFDDSTRYQVALRIRDEVQAVIAAALGDLAVLTPGPDQAAVHQVFVDHLTTLDDIWQAFPKTLVETTVSVGGGSPITVDARVTVTWYDLQTALHDAACAARAAFLIASNDLGAADPDSTLPALGLLWLEGEGTGCP